MTQTAALPAWLGHVDETDGWLSLDEARLLHTLAGEVENGCIVEVGAYRGRSAIALSAGARPGVPIYSIDPHAEMWTDGKLSYAGPEDRAAFFEAMTRSGAWRNVNLLNSTSDVLAPGWREPIGLLWIDGDHSLEAARSDWSSWQPHLVPGSTVVFDDAHDPNVGPFHVIKDMIEAGTLEHRKNVGKVRSLIYTP